MNVNRARECGSAFSFFAVALVGALLGTISSLVAWPLLSTAAAENRAIRGTSLEIVDSRGVRRAVLAIKDESGSVGLELFDQRGIRRIELGIVGDEPTLNLNDATGQTELVLALREGYKPELGMSEKNFQGRITLGVNRAGDVYIPNQPPKTWALTFTGDLRGASRPLAMIVMDPEVGAKVFVRDLKGRRSLLSPDTEKPGSSQ